MSVDSQDLLSVATRAAREAAQFILGESSKRREVDFKGATDLVTQADRGSEEMILDRICRQFPDHGILTEESPGKPGDSPYTWIVDPLDGTTNFVHGYPFYAVSIAVYAGNNPVVGVIVDVPRGDIYRAASGNGAYLSRGISHQSPPDEEETPISVSSTGNLEHTLLATGFPYVHDEIWSRNFDRFKAFTNRTQGVRRAGSAALDLAHVARGWLDGFWEFGLHPWDTAAGVLLVSEAGGKVSLTDGTPFTLLDREIVASNGHVHAEMLKVFSSLRPS
ncbi:MAG: inositol monophosphatase family protein [Fidelibacterota bacterium]